MAAFTLIAADGIRTQDPDPATIASAVRALTIDNWFVILEENDATFLQVAVKPDWYALERRAGGDQSHVGAEVATIEEVIEAFQAYARQDPDWTSRFTWAPVKL
jgi:hypothetical protein